FTHSSYGRRFHAHKLQELLPTGMISRQMLIDLEEQLGRVGQATNVNVVIIRASGTVFSAGHDLREILGHDAGDVRALFQQCARTMSVIRHLPQIVIAEVAGIATAAGCQLVAACDLAIASETAQFATPGVKIGYFCASPSVQVARNVPRKKVAEMLFTGDFISAADAQASGMVNRVVPEEALAVASWQFAQQIARWSLPVLAAGKEFLHQQLEMTEEGAAQYGVEYMTRQSPTPDAMEGMTAFLEKRAPQWSDR
ncbi:enoyl-CoA hydratase-related protein, partial [Sulfobacillus harzensis]